MLEYASKYYDKLLIALLEHLGIVVSALAISLVLAALLAVPGCFSGRLSRIMLSVLSMVYSIPSLALLAVLIPLTGLGHRTAVITLVIYNQYLLLRNFLAGLGGVDPAVLEAAEAMGMTRMQRLVRVQVPLARASIIAGIRIAMVSTVGIATIAASINAGGLGTLLFDGLRTMNTVKILWGSLLSAGLAIGLDRVLSLAERKKR